MILGTAGHIDHGKTALVRALTGVDTDRLPEEKRRGITIDLGFAPLEIDGIGTIGIVDVPGHEAFIRTMLAGASGIDIALLVIAADEGVMPQTREHLEILSLLGVSRGVVALTKSDLVDEEWIALQIEEVTSLLAPTLFALASIVPVSSRTGSGIVALKNAIAVQAGDLPARGIEDLFRMPVDRAFTVKGTGTVVTGTIWSGSVERDATLIVQPGNKTVRVRGLEHHGVMSATASAGQRTAIALSGVNVADVPRGSVLVADNFWSTTKEVEAYVTLNQDHIRITPRSHVLFHLGTAETEARLVMDDEVSSGGQIHARIHLVNPIVARAGDRFVLRMASPARTVGGGRVVDPFPAARRRGRNKPRASHRMAQSPEIISSLLLEAILRDASTDGVTLSTLPIRTGDTRSNVDAYLASTGAVTKGSRAYLLSAAELLSASIESFVAEFVANHPLEPGVSLQAIRSGAKAGDEIVDWAVARLVDLGRIEVSGSFVRPRGWKPELGDADKAVSDAIMYDICKQPSEPPTVAELEAKFGGKTRSLIRKLEREGVLARVSDDRYYSSEAVAQMVEKLRTSLQANRIYSPAELKEVLGVSRKYLIPFLEFCDGAGVTERSQAGRAVRPLAVGGQS